MQKNLKKLMLLIAGFTSALSMTSCGESYSDQKYTYYSYLSTSPGTWNVHNWETSDESYITGFTEMGLYDVILNSTKDGYEFTTEMASAYPVDVYDTASPDEWGAINETYNLRNITNNQVWDIKLNEKATWEDGTKITATDYVESMKRQLDPKMLNFRADSYYSSNLVIANAEAYYKSNRNTVEPLYDYLNKDTLEFINEKDKETADGNYILNLGAYTPFVQECFSNATSDTTLYSVLDQYGVEGKYAYDAVNRIIDAVKYYGLYYVDHAKAENKDDWEKCKSPTDVNSDMLDYNVPINNFDNSKYTIKVRNSSIANWTDESSLQNYSKDDLINDINAFLKAYKKKYSSNAYRLVMFGEIKNSEFNDFNKVGIKAVDDYTVRLVLSKQISLLDLKFALTSNWLVNVKLYDKLKKVEASQTYTKYATANVDNYMSYGPYKLTEFKDGHSFTIEKNDKWYGYTDGNHIGQYQMTGIKTTIITEHSTAVGKFEQGLLDDLSLDSNDMKTYGNSSRLTTTPESYTQKISFNTNRAKLKSRQGNGNINKTILANYNFRKGLSLSLNRAQFASQTTAGSKPFTGLLNELYLTDVEIGEMYNSTEQGKSIYNQVYGELGGDPYADDYTPTALSTTAYGYNQQQAIYYVEKAIKEEIESSESGHLKNGDNITIEFRVYDNESETTKLMAEFLKSAFTTVIKAAVKKYNENNGASINLDFTLSTVKDEDYYNSAKAGNYDMIFSIWGGAAINPYGLMQVYCDPEFESVCEYGFKGNQDKETLSIDMDGNGVIGDFDYYNANSGSLSSTSTSETQTYYYWYSELVNGSKEPDIEGYDRNDEANKDLMNRYNTIHNQRLTMLAGLEAGIINRFEAIPLVARGESSLTSFKVNNGTDTYINLVGYGGVRFMTFNYSDKAWHEYIESKDYDKNLYKL